MSFERIDKIIANQGICSRKEVKQLIRGKQVLLDGVPVKSPEEKADPVSSVITVRGEQICAQPHVYLMLYKPAGVVSATEDRTERTVLDLLPEEYRRRGVFPVGRLDKDTEGLLLLTDDGDLAHRLLSPKKHVEKQYYAVVDGTLSEDDVLAFRNGLTLKDGTMCLPALLQIETSRECAAMVTILEGKYHQIKRMFAACGHHVVYLKRVRMGPLRLDENLEKGAFRPLTKKEQEVLLRKGSDYLQSMV